MEYIPHIISGLASIICILVLFILKGIKKDVDKKTNAELFKTEVKRIDETKERVSVLEIETIKREACIEHRGTFAEYFKKGDKKFADILAAQSGLNTQMALLVLQLENIGKIVDRRVNGDAKE